MTTCAARSTMTCIPQHTHGSPPNSDALPLARMTTALQPRTPTAAGSHQHRYAYQMDNRRWFGLNLRKVKKKGAKRKPGKGTAKPGSAAAVGDAEDERACSDGSDEEQGGGRRARVLVPLANRDAEEIEEWDDWERSALARTCTCLHCQLRLMPSQPKHTGSSASGLGTEGLGLQMVRNEP